MSCDGGHLGFPIGIKNIKFVEGSNAFFSETTNIIKAKLYRMFIGWSSTNFMFFVPI
jgi:hypothetical protein